MALELTGRPLLRGTAEGKILLCAKPLSLWGGIDPLSGRIIDRRHDRCGEVVTGRVLALPGEKGSSTGSAVLLEMIRAGTAPAAILLERLAPILALGGIVADELYGRSLPIVTLSGSDYRRLADGVHVGVDENGAVLIP